MKTSKEMKLKVLEKVIKNIQEDRYMCEDIEVYHPCWDIWVSESPSDGLYFEFEDYAYRVKPETININGVEIPRPLGIKDIHLNENYYFPQCHSKMYEVLKGDTILEYNIFFPYSTKEEAIEASKKLFGVT